MSRETILLVEDEEDLLEVSRYNLVKEGYQVIPVTTGEEALEIARTRLPDLVLLDLMLPGINGLDVCRLLRGDPKTRAIPVIMVWLALRPLVSRSTGSASCPFTWSTTGPRTSIVMPAGITVLSGLLVPACRRSTTWAWLPGGGVSMAVSGTRRVENACFAAMRRSGSSRVMVTALWDAGGRSCISSCSATVTPVRR